MNTEHQPDNNWPEDRWDLVFASSCAIERWKASYFHRSRASCRYCRSWDTTPIKLVPEMVLPSPEGDQYHSWNSQRCGRTTKLPIRRSKRWKEESVRTDLFLSRMHGMRRSAKLTSAKSSSCSALNVDGGLWWCGVHVGPLGRHQTTQRVRRRLLYAGRRVQGRLCQCRRGAVVLTRGSPHCSPPTRWWVHKRIVPGASWALRCVVGAELSRFRCGIGGCYFECTNSGDYERHYGRAHRHICSECGMRFRSQRLLHIHFPERHDEYFQVLAAKKRMVQKYLFHIYFTRPWCNHAILCISSNAWWKNAIESLIPVGVGCCTSSTSINIPNRIGLNVITNLASKCISHHPVSVKVKRICICVDRHNVEEPRDHWRKMLIMPTQWKLTRRRIFLYRRTLVLVEEAAEGLDALNYLYSLIVPGHKVGTYLKLEYVFQFYILYIFIRALTSHLTSENFDQKHSRPNSWIVSKFKRGSSALKIILRSSSVSHLLISSNRERSV